MSKFMLILHQTPNVGGYRNSSPEEFEGILEKFRAWGRRLSAEGKLLSGEKLAEEAGKIVSANQGGVAVVDGPYSETREVVGGYFLIQAEDYDEAVEIAHSCPGLAFGSIAVRRVDPISGSAGCVLPASETQDQNVEAEVTV